MKKNLLPAFFFLGSLLLFQCNSPMVKKDQLVYLHQKYSGQYVTLKPIDVGNNEVLPTGSLVMLYFKSTSEAIVAYAYRTNQSREMVIGKNILFMFESDFPNSDFKMEIFETRLAEMVSPAPEIPPAQPTKKQQKI